ncbi:MAG: hypothetical protein OER56_14150 [Hyphomicrobiales bacterium]|nr:hypothetical protein [Hyphomicrobiales bacterium]
MDRVFELKRTVAERGTWRTLYDFRFVAEDDRTVHTGQLRNGYLAKDIAIHDAAGGQCGSFGPNRRIAPSAHLLKSADGAVIAKISHGMVQSTWGGSGSPVETASGELIAVLTPGETVKETIAGKIDAWSADLLVLLRDTEFLGHVGPRETPDMPRGIASNVTRLAVELPAALAKSFQHEILGRKVDWPETVAARIALTGTGCDLDTRLILAIVLFKLHYHDLRRV